MNTSKIETWHKAYEAHLAQAMLDRPNDYSTNVSAKTIAKRARRTLVHKGLNAINVLSSTAWKRTAKQFGIKNTYKAWNEWFND